MKIVFSDLDGTLLDHNTYSFQMAREGLELLRANSVQLVMVSSKTFFEMNSWREKFEIETPFIFENGAGIAYPEFTMKDIKFLGASSDILLEKIPLLKETLNQNIKTFADMTVEDIIDSTGLSAEVAEKAKKRTASMPFVLEDELTLDDINKVNDLVSHHDIVITRGGRFYHLMSKGVSKGNAVIDYVEDLKKNTREEIITMGIGDSLNDIPLLKIVDYPFAVKKHDNSHMDVSFKVKFTEGIGPAGFTEAVKEFLNN